MIRYLNTCTVVDLCSPVPPRSGCPPHSPAGPCYCTAVQRMLSIIVTVGPVRLEMPHAHPPSPTRSVTNVNTTVSSIEFHPECPWSAERPRARATRETWPLVSRPSPYSLYVIAQIVTSITTAGLKQSSPSTSDGKHTRELKCGNRDNRSRRRPKPQTAVNGTLAGNITKESP